MLNRLATRNVNIIAKASEELSPALAAFLSPLAAMAFAMSIWALGAQIAVAYNFPIAQGALADWRAWLLIAVALEAVSLRSRSQTSGR
jgi:hypothetical protein